MIKNLKRFVLALCVIALCASVMCTAAFAASDSLVAEIPVSITLNGTLPSTAEKFVVQVKAAEAGYPLPEGASGEVYSMEMSLTSDGNVISDMLAIDFSTAGLGVYDYTIELVAGEDPDCYYDSSVYNVKVYIVNKEDFSGKEMHVVITCNDEKPDSIDFVNRYADPAMVTVSAIKTLNGGVPYSNMFLFQLIDENGEIVSEVRNENGTVTFEELVFGEPEDLGQHTFTLKEVDENANSIVYDKSVYTVVINVTKDEDGNYQAKLSYELKGEPYEGTPTFANKQKIANSPYTGDNLQILIWGASLVVSAVALLAVLLIARKKRMIAASFQQAIDQDSDSDLDI